MGRSPRVLFAAGMLTIATALPVMAAGAAVEQTLYVIVANQADVPADVLSNATRNLALIYRAVGVDVIVVDGLPAGMSGPMVAVNIVNNRICHRLPVSQRALGSAYPRGTLAYVMYERIADFSARSRTDVAQTLGIVMAHEIAHLLLPKSSHAPFGLMAASWTTRDLQLAGTNGLRFSTLEGGMIRAGLAGRD